MPASHDEKPAETLPDGETVATLPDPLYQMIRGYVPSRCILTALELDIFTAVAEGADAERLASTIGASPY